jgi:hypothetical protein
MGALPGDDTATKQSKLPRLSAESKNRQQGPTQC